MSNNGKVTHVVQIVALTDSEGNEPDRYGLYVDGERVADCAKPSTAVNSLSEAIKVILNGVYPAVVEITGIQNLPWESATKAEKKQPVYEEVDLDAALALAGGEGG